MLLVNCENIPLDVKQQLDAIKEKEVKEENLIVEKEKINILKPERKRKEDDVLYV